MAQQTINLGAAPDDGTGDTLRAGGDKINDNFDELYDEALKFKGSTDCSTNPNYPAALKGDAYRVSVAGKIGGASGVDVEVADLYFATADNAGGDQATVGTSWSVLQGNITSYLPLSGGTLTGDLIVPDEAYDATNWDGNLEVPTKNAVRDKIESLGAGTITELDDIPDVNAPTPANGDVLTWDSTPGEWVSAAPTGGANALDDLTDVAAPTPSDGDVLTFDSGSGDWVSAAPSGGGTPSGTSFPGSPATDDLFYRTDRRIEYFYDGTRWLSTQLCTLALPVPNGSLASDFTLFTAIPWLGVYSLYLERIDVSTMYDGASANWHVVLFYINSANSNTIIADVDGSTPNAANTWYNRGAAIGSVLNAAAVAFNVTYDEQGGAANFRGGAILSYRLVG